MCFSNCFQHIKLALCDTFFSVAYNVKPIYADKSQIKRN